VINLTLADNSRRQVEGEWVDGPITFWDIVSTRASTKGRRVGRPQLAIMQA
jgi:hypothetical protein